MGYSLQLIFYVGRVSDSVTRHFVEHPVGLRYR